MQSLLQCLVIAAQGVIGFSGLFHLVVGYAGQILKLIELFDHCIHLIRLLHGADAHIRLSDNCRIQRRHRLIEIVVLLPDSVGTCRSGIGSLRRFISCIQRCQLVRVRGFGILSAQISGHRGEQRIVFGQGQSVALPDVVAVQRIAQTNDHVLHVVVWYGAASVICVASVRIDILPERLQRRSGV